MIVAYSKWWNSARNAIHPPQQAYRQSNTRVEIANVRIVRKYMYGGGGALKIKMQYGRGSLLYVMVRLFQLQLSSAGKKGEHKRSLAT
jgi:hypothetical protein